MRIHTKVGAIAAAGALVVAVPAMAHPGPPANHANHPSQSHKCTAHNVAYIVSGTVDSTQGTLTLTKNSNGTYSTTGSLVVDVTRTNHWAKGEKTGTQPSTFALTSTTQIRLDNGLTSIAAGDRVKLIGKQGVFAKKCNITALSPTFRMVVVHAPAKKS